MASKHKLSFAFIRSASAGKYSDGAGLWLHKRDDGGSQWFLRISIGGKRREMGLGGYPEISIKQAREDAETFRSAARNDIDPIQHRDQQKRELLNSNNTLEKISYEAFEARKAELKEDGKAGRWFTPIKLHVLPKIGNIRIEEINQHNIKNALEPIWHSKADTARKAMNRLNLIFKYAVAMDLDVDINAVTKAKILLGKTRHKPVKIPALHWRDIPAFYETLEEITPVNLAMRLLILTGVRSKPLRHFRLEEIQDNIWVIPSANMKGRKDKVSDFRVPLSQEAKNVIELAMPFSRDGYLFTGIQKGVISDATMSRKMERRGMVESPHGFRSSLRTWLADCTDAPHEVCETILAHKSGTDNQLSYIRTDHIEQRKILMERWAAFVCKSDGQIIKLQNVL